MAAMIYFDYSTSSIGSASETMPEPTTHYLAVEMPPEKPPRTLCPSTREKKQASQAAGPVAKTSRSRSGTLTRTIINKLKILLPQLLVPPIQGAPQHRLHTCSGCSMLVPILPLWGMGYQLQTSHQHSGVVHEDPPPPWA